jgi:uncharacterized protein (TIGR03083 family)
MIDYLSLLRADAAALAEAVRAAGPDAPVPPCPDWRVADLLQHITNVHRTIETVVRTRSLERVDYRTLPPLVGDPLDSFEEAVTRLVDTLAEAPPDEPVWNWSVNQPKVAAFWPRRMAQETAVHRWDAQAAASAVTPVDTALAVDGIDELLDVFLTARASWLPDTTVLAGSVHFHCTDAEGEWLVRIDDGVVDVVREHGKGDAAVRGTASDLLLYGWNRIGPDAPGLEVFGDPAVLESWQQLQM